jgi:acyl dehydratase
MTHDGRTSSVDRSLFFEDVEVGLVLTSPARTVTETDLVTFCMLSGDWNPIHSDHESSKDTHYGRPVVHGLFGMSLLTGLMDRAGWFTSSAAALLGIREWSFRGPIFVGDTLHCQMEISDKRMTSRGDRGVVGRIFRLVNQRGETVQEGEMPVMLLSRGQGAA